MTKTRFFQTLLITDILALVIIGSILLILAPWLFRVYFQLSSRRFIRILFSDPYTQNLLEGYTALKKFGIQWVFENELRAQNGKALEKPIGTGRPFPHFDGLLLTPPTIRQRPLELTNYVNLHVVIGKKCIKPLDISMPILVSAMGYGVALQKPIVEAIALGTEKVGTACNVGQGPAIEEWTHAGKLVVQHHRAPWGPDEHILRRADMIEIRLGQGANMGSGTFVPSKGVSSEILRDLGLTAREIGYIPAGHPEIERMVRFRTLISRLRKIGGGVPIAVKIAASHFIEEDIEWIVKAGADVVVLDGAQGGTHSSPGILVDDFGIPTLSALCRATKFMRRYGYNERVDLIVSGGIRTPGDVMKALCLGASAVYMGTAALFAVVHTQLDRALPFEPPTQMAWANSEITTKFDVAAGTQALSGFLQSCADEIGIGLRALGKSSLSELDEEDLVAWQPEVARITGRPLV
ncbi:glutamate synthase (ferredoxin) [Alicyclobacillus hesperidum URH17-3-68]|uniref:FMN-binding glutamate synthase family protein n=1 Tax=Alicyclobacillus hesperidum TaxID=89784 RepID=A0AA37U2W4_9BACL|nr:FMN-binding glutamate synthase family protein [Alicyclobacillus hesperidum]EJY56366.1 glutamate synthase (ferredoxin) [Alicyclobacillus hesperidum URH17-3-68]GLV14966.1 FMN-binding glutamate synthase family protein [Alicyclobacillus hesperidum]